MGRGGSVRAAEQHGLGELDPPPDYDDGRLEIRPRRFLALADGEPVQLTTRELALLVELRRHESVIRSREQLRAGVWGEDADVSLRSVDVLVARVRSKLDDALPDLSYIHSYHGFGYDFSRDKAY
jgi:DNA-binding response OmpR family regulator